jgi:GDP-L-fucose synthase
MADACVFLMESGIGDGLFNIGTGSDVTIRELAETIRRVVAFQGDLEWDASKPDGTPRKLLDVSKMAALGWRARIPLEQGIRDTYAWFEKYRSSDR